MKRWGFLLCSVFFALILSACAEDLTLEVSTDFESISESSGDFQVGYFLNGKVPKQNKVTFSIDKYKDGKHELFNTARLNEGKFDNKYITFEVNTENSNGIVVRFGSSDLILIENFQDEHFSGNSYGGVFTQSYEFPEPKGSILGYWYGSSTDELEKVNPQANEAELLEFLKQQELAYILYAGLTIILLEEK